MTLLHTREMALASGGDLALAVSGAASGTAYHLGQALVTGKLSFKSLAVSAVAGIALTRTLDDVDVAIIASQSLFTTLGVAGACGYLTSFAQQVNDNETHRFPPLY